MQITLKYSTLWKSVLSDAQSYMLYRRRKNQRMTQVKMFIHF